MENNQQIWQKIWLWGAAALGLPLLAQAALLWAYGPIFTPDSAGYIDFARLILTEDAWRSDAGFDEFFLPVTAFRVIGYPAYVAGVMALAPDHWAGLVVLGQMLAALVASVIFYGFARAVLPLGWAAFATFAAAFGLRLTLDLSLLPDSLHASLWIALLSIMGRAMILHRRPTPAMALGLGILLALAFLLRENVAYLAPLLLPFLIAWLWAARSGWGRGAINAIFFFLPLLAVHQSYQAWNAARTGTPFVTIGGQTALLYAVMNAGRADPALLEGGAEVEQAARAHLDTGHIGEVQRALRDLWQAGHRGPQLTAMVSAAYARAWAQHPSVMALRSLEKINEKLAFLAFRPLASLQDAVEWAHEGARLAEVWPHIPHSLYRLAKNIERVVAGLLTLGFLVAPIVWAWRRLGPRDHPFAAFAVGVWLWFWGLVAFFSLIHIEERYLAPAAAFVALIGLVAIKEWTPKILRRWPPKKSQTPV